MAHVLLKRRGRGGSSTSHSPTALADWPVLWVYYGEGVRPLDILGQMEVADWSVLWEIRLAHGTPAVRARIAGGTADAKFHIPPVLEPRRLLSAPPPPRATSRPMPFVCIYGVRDRESDK